MQAPMTADTVIAYITHDDRPSIVGVNGVKRRGGSLPTVTCAEPHSRRSGHGTTTFSATIFFSFLCLSKSQPNRRYDSTSAPHGGRTTFQKPTTTLGPDIQNFLRSS